MIFAVHQPASIKTLTHGNFRAIFTTHVFMCINVRFINTEQVEKTSEERRWTGKNGKILSSLALNRLWPHHASSVTSVTHWLQSPSCGVCLITPVPWRHTHYTHSLKWSNLFIFYIPFFKRLGSQILLIFYLDILFQTMHFIQQFKCRAWGTESVYREIYIYIQYICT